MENLKAVAKNVRGSAQKMRIPARVVIGMGVEEAVPVLEYMEKKAAADINKVLKSAVANAVNNYKKEVKNLYVKNIIVGEGVKYKRFKPKAKGMASPIFRRFSNITVFLAEIEEKKVQKEKKKQTKTTTNKVNK